MAWQTYPSLSWHTVAIGEVYCCGICDIYSHMVIFIRYQYQDFTPVLFRRTFDIAFVQPDLGTDIFIPQFSNRVWILVIVLIALSGVGMLVIFEFQAKITKRKANSEFSTLGWVFGRSASP